MQQNQVKVNKRAAGYFRVSSEEQVEGYSISAQERAYRLFVEAHGYTSVGEYSDEGRSARTDNIKKRPQFARMLQDAQAGLFDVIVVHKMDRFSRSLRVAVQVFELLGKCNIGLVSVSEPNLDYSTPQGMLFMHMLWALAQFYSDNLSQETKKGKNERKLQGLYNGTLPFGVIKGENGIPIPDRRDIGLGPNRTNYDGVKMIFNMAASGSTAREIAEKLNSYGYRTTGSWGNNLFTKDTVTDILRSRFYLGELPDGEYTKGHSSRGSYTKGIEGKHEKFIDPEIWEAAKRNREANNKYGSIKITKKASTYSLSGLLVCSYCGGKMHIQGNRRGTPYLYCYKRQQGIAKECQQHATKLEIYEQQIEQYLRCIKLPEDYQQQIIEAYKKEDEEGPGFEKMRQALTNRLNRLKEIYEWGDMTAEEYRFKKEQLRNELVSLPAPISTQKDKLESLGTYLKNIGVSWQDASQELRNELARTLFEKIRVEDHEIRGITPTSEFIPLLTLSSFRQCMAEAEVTGLT